MTLHFFYTYNTYGELTKAVEKYSTGTYTYDYAYDSGENIRTEKVTGPSGTKTHTYTYDSAWKDQLVKYDGKSISYDQMGNPTNYMGAKMTWDVKGNLTSVSGRNGKSASYTYLSDGQRYTRTTGGKKTTYLYNNGLLLSETTGNEVISYYYDSDGTILGIGYKKGTGAEKHYFFEKNAFGDVIAVYRNSDSLLIGTYEYDLWGNPVSVKEAAAGRDTDGILGKNPFRYRCYYYDTETGFYYLNSRYYDPQTRRFISADNVVAGSGTSVLGYNLYAYCVNNPVNMSDSSGNWPQWMKSAANWVNNTIIQPVVNFFDPSTNRISGEFQSGIFFGSGSLTGGYSETNNRIEVKSKEDGNDGMYGIFDKISLGNAEGRIGIGNEKVSLSLKGVADGLSGTAQAGMQCRDGLGGALRAKGSVLSGRATIELNVYGWEIEAGVSGDLLSIGAEAVGGYFPNEGFDLKKHISPGLYGVGYVFRVKPAQ